MSTNPAGGTGEERRQRLRDQMKAFYGDPSASAKRAAAQASSQGSPNVPPELDLDSEYFNVNRYTTDLLKRESLKGLVETDTELLRRVRRLDGELQELVYRNYARFISATDTIREMKDNVVEMDAKLQTLSQNVSRIDGISSQISQQLRVHRSQIEETITANRMLKKVQFLTSLPTTMRRLIDKEEFNMGVKYWVAGDNFLTKHKSIASITQIQQTCCQLAGELYRAIEQRMCSYPLDDPDAMDRIRNYVEDLRLLRATSLFESAHMGDQPPFEESVLQTLMKSVTASFQANVATTQRSLRALLVVPEDINTMELAEREASLTQVNLREPLAQLKNACAMLAVNSERVYALLDANTSTAEASNAAAQVAKDIQPVLTEMLQPLAQLLTDFALAHLDAIAMDGGSATRNPTASAEALQSATTHLAQLLKQFVTAMKTLAEIYLSPLVSSDSTKTTNTPPRSGGGRNSSNSTNVLVRGSAAVGSPGSTDNAVQRYAAAVHDAACSVLQQCYERVREKITQAPDAAILKACVPLPLANTSVVVPALPPTDEHTLKLGFVLTRFLYASLAQCAANALCSILSSEDSLPIQIVAETIANFERAAVQLQHRAIILLGQLEVQSIYAASFSGASSNNETNSSSNSKTTCLGSTSPGAAAAAAANPLMVQTALMQLLSEWSIVYDAVNVLPAVTAVLATDAHNTSAPAGPGGRFMAPAGGSNMPASSPALRRRDTSFTTGSGATNTGTGGTVINSGYRGGAGGAYSGGGGGSSNGGGARGGNQSDHRVTNTGSTHQKSGKLTVAYTRQVMSALQLSVNNIFANTETTLRTEPYGGAAPSAIMACVVRYVLQGIVDLVRDEATYNEVQFQRLQVSCTFLLYALLAPAKGTAPRQWRKEWSDDDFSQVQRLLDEACTCAYEKYEAKVPLAATVLEKVVEAAVRGGRAALAVVAADSANTATASVIAPMPPVATVDFIDDAPLQIPAALQRTVNINSTAASGVDSEAASPVLHDDPLRSPRDSKVSSIQLLEETPSSKTSSRPFTPVAVPTAAAAQAAAMQSPPQSQPSAGTPAPAPASPAALLPKISTPPASAPRPTFSSAAASAATTAAAKSVASPTAKQALTVQCPPPSAPTQSVAAPAAAAAAAPVPTVTGAQYYGKQQTERVARIDDEELPM